MVETEAPPPAEDEAPSHPREVYGLPSAASPELPELLAAISVDDGDRVRELLSAHPGLISERLTPQSSLPLTLAARDCSTNALRALLEHGADVRADHHAALFRACTGECPEAARLLIRHGADVNAVLPDYGPILMGACECMALECVRLLLAHGADPNARSDGKPARANPFLATPLGMLLGSGERSEHLPAIVRALVEAGAEVEDTPVMVLHQGDLPRLRRLLEEDPSLVRRRFALPYGDPPLDNATLLHVAAEFGYAPAAELLLQHGADPDARSGPNGHGTTARQRADRLPTPLAGKMRAVLEAR
jgi:ankyrin repeat protein